MNTIWIIQASSNDSPLVFPNLYFTDEEIADQSISKLREKYPTLTFHKTSLFHCPEVMKV